MKEIILGYTHGDYIFCSVLIDLIKGYKNHKDIYSRNTPLW